VVKVAIVGAGIAGIATAKMLTQNGFDIQVFEKGPDVGGVWSRSRRYPGLHTQNTKHNYCFSDHPMPADYPTWPSGAQMQAYLDSYVDRFGFREAIALNSEVVAAEPESSHLDARWTLTVRYPNGDCERAHCDHLVIANGVFSDPAMPTFVDQDAFQQAGHRILHASQFTDLQLARGKPVVVVGYGKSACDVATAVSEVASSTTVVARRLLWKMPRRLGRLIGYEQLMNRTGEAGFAYIEPRLFERFLHGPGRPLRDAIYDIIEAVVTRQLRLGPLRLIPAGRFEEIAVSSESLATEGFFEQVAAGEITVHRDAEITGMLPAGAVELSNGIVVPAELVVCATGFRQRVPFLDPDVQRRLIDENGNFRLYRQIVSPDIPNLSFAGYNSSGMCLLSAEIGALWTAGFLMGEVALPQPAQQHADIARRLTWMEERSRGRHGHGTVITPFSIHNVDEMLEDLGVNIGLGARALQWVGRIKPGAYRKLTSVSSPDPAAAGKPANSRGWRPTGDSVGDDVPVVDLSR
jgi:dimethylaniline monooxygenase (N-oxide forming)